MKKKYIIKVYDNDNDHVIHTEMTEEVSPQEIEKIVNSISEMVGKEYLIKYEEVKS